jgi:hypothetical protein
MYLLFLYEKIRIGLLDLVSVGNELAILNNIASPNNAYFRKIRDTPRFSLVAALRSLV